MDTDDGRDLPLDFQALTFGMETLVVIGELDGFRGVWPILSRMTEDQLAALAESAAAENAEAACRLEGVPADDVIAARYREAFAVALQDGDAPSEAWISSLHLTLVGDQADAGIYKTQPNTAEAFDADGKSLGAVFATDTPDNVPQRMAALTTWVERALAEDAAHPLIAIAIFVALFLEIHPFRIGTIRLASILSTALLVRSGYAHARYGSLDRAIEAGKYSYYLSLRRTLGSLRTAQPDWKHWLDFFLRALRQQKRNLEDKIASDRAVGDDLPDLSARILAMAREQGRVTIAMASKATGISRNTVKDHVGRLAEQGHLTLHGAGRGAWYGLR